MKYILRVNKGGLPQGWINWQEAVLHYTKDQVVWTHGETALRVYGGMNRIRNERSYLDLHPIIAVKGDLGKNRFDSIPPLTNRELFRRDQHSCMYCMTTMPDKHLTRDHVVPVSRDGKDVWSNVVTSCRSCNHRKADRLLSEINMQLKAVPFVPNHAEWLILKNRHILTDQMAFLKAQCPKDRRVMF